MLAFFIPIAEALLVGYAASLAMYMGLLFLITRLHSRVLLDNSRVRLTYTVLNAIAWACAALVGAYLCCGMSPLPPYGFLGFPLCLAAILCLVLLRAFRQLRGHMSIPALLLNVFAIFGGTSIALSANHVFTMLSHLA